MHLIYTPILLLGACGEVPSETPTPDTAAEGVWGQEALDYVSENLAKTFTGEWQIYRLDASNEEQKQYGWTDEIEGTNPRIEGDRAIVDILDVMNGGTWTHQYTFIEGVYITDSGGVGDYFMEQEGEVTIMTETSPDVWEYTLALTDTDLQAIANVNADNLVSGSKHATKRVSIVEDELERHDVTMVTAVTFVDDSGTEQTLTFTSMVGYHQESPAP